MCKSSAPQPPPVQAEITGRDNKEIISDSHWVIKVFEGGTAGAVAVIIIIALLLYICRKRWMACCQPTSRVVTPFIPPPPPYSAAVARPPAIEMTNFRGLQSPRVRSNRNSGAEEDETVCDPCYEGL